MLRAKLLRPFLPLLMAVLLPACVGGAGFGGASLTTIAENSNTDGDVELILEPLDVWDGKGVGELEVFEIDGKSMSFRLRNKDIFEQAWVRLGLFWDSRQEKIYMPVVIAGGPPVTLQKARFEAGHNRATLAQARNFNFKPGKRAFDKEDELSSGVFVLPASMLSKVADAEDVWITVQTTRGSLRVNLAVVTGRGNDVLKGSGKYQFAEFYRRRQARL